MVQIMPSRRYTTREVARLLSLPERRIRTYVYAGVVTGGRAELRPRGRGAGRRLRFEFRDVLVLKTAKKLLAAGLPPIKVENALTALKRQLPEGRPLSAVRVGTEYGVIVVSDGEVRWEPVSGQACLQLAPVVKRSGSGAGPTPPRTGDDTATVAAKGTLADIVRSKKLGICISDGLDATQSADGWFNLALDLEEDDPDGAYEAYLRSLALDPEHVEASINVGRLCSEAGDDYRAAAYFRQASRVDPSHPVAHFNLAVTMHDQGHLEAALASYQATLIHDPEFADAHFNLAALLEEMGDHAGAEQHMEAYRLVVNNEEG